MVETLQQQHQQQEKDEAGFRSIRARVFPLSSDLLNPYFKIGFTFEWLQEVDFRDFSVSTDFILRAARHSLVHLSWDQEHTFWTYPEWKLEFAQVHLHTSLFPNDLVNTQAGICMHAFVFVCAHVRACVASVNSSVPTRDIWKIPYIRKKKVQQAKCPCGLMALQWFIKNKLMFG